MHRPRRRGARPPLLALLAALLLAARGAAAQGKRRVPRLPSPPGPRPSALPVGQPGAGHTGRAEPASGRPRPVVGLADATPGAAEAGEALPGSPAAGCARHPLLGAQLQLSALTARRGWGEWGTSVRFVPPVSSWTLIGVQASLPS